MKLGGDKSEVEVKIEKGGDLNALQRYRYATYFSKTARDSDLSYQLLDTEEDLREVVQEEISIREGPDALGDDAKERLSVLNTKYWLLSQQWWRWRSDMEYGIQSRGFDLWRSHPRWYMHRELIKHCAGRQGCCARGCGCCVDRKIDSSRRLGVGHCTLECGCCRRARAFEVSEEDKKSLKEEFKNNKDSKSSYRLAKMRRVSIWGLTGDNWENPFDMIDAPPSYDQIEAKDKNNLVDWLQNKLQR